MPYLFETDDHRALREQVGRFAARAIAPHATAWDEAGEFPRALYREAAEAGILGLGYPEELGGVAGDLTHVLVAQDELIRMGKSVGTTVGLGSHGIALPPILRLGTPEQRRRFVPPVLRGDAIAALAITEPGTGSDVAGITTRADREGDAWVVRGAKMFITSGCRADLVTALVRTGPDPHAGLSLLVVERGTPGFSVSNRLHKTGWWASDTAALSFDDCRVPAGNLLGQEGDGFAAIVLNFVHERLYMAGQCVAIASLALAESASYARERRAFGRPIAGFQVIRHKLADMATSLAATRALVGEVTVRAQRGEDVVADAAMAKNAATDMVTFVCDEAVQIHGGAGTLRETVVERLFRDARLYPIGGGTREIMNEIISKRLGL